MSFRVVLIENQMDIKVKLDNLVFIKDEGEVRIPVSDISTIVIDNLKLNISMRISLPSGAEQCRRHHL